MCDDVSFCKNTMCVTSLEYNSQMISLSYSFNKLAAMYEISRTLSVLFSRNVRVNSCLIKLWTVVPSDHNNYNAAS